MIKMPPIKLPQFFKQKFLVWIGYTGFFLFCFFVFAYLTFPYDRARAHFIRQFNHKKLPGGHTRLNDVQLKIGTLEPSWITGVKMTDISITKSTTRVGKKPVQLLLDSVKIRPSIISLLLGETDLLFSVRIGQGEIEGSYQQDESEIEVLAAIEKVDVSSLGLDTVIGLPIVGIADGAVNLSIPKDRTKSKGNIHLKIAKLVAGDGKAKLKVAALRDGITIDAINAGNLQLRMKVDKGLGEIEQFTADGPDLSVDGTGTLMFAKQLKLTRINMTLELNFKNHYRNRSGRTKAMFSLLEMHPTLKRAKTPTGALRYQITGLITSPRYRPAGRVRMPTKRK